MFDSIKSGTYGLESSSMPTNDSGEEGYHTIITAPKLVETRLGLFIDTLESEKEIKFYHMIIFSNSIKKVT